MPAFPGVFLEYINRNVYDFNLLLAWTVSTTTVCRMMQDNKMLTVNPLYTDIRYNDKIRYNDNLNVTKPSLRR